MADYVELYRVAKTYPQTSGDVVIVDNFNLDIAEGEFVSLIGHSGCGKSTVLSMIAGLTTISRGQIVVARREIDGPGPDRGVVFQSPCLLPWLTAIDNVLLGIDRVFPHVPRAERRAMALYYLELVGLADSAKQLAKELSQGMQQRVGIARAFALAPKMILLDEPFGMLDSLTRFELQEVLIELLAQTKATTLMVTHDIDEALFMSDRVVMMTSGPAATVGEILHVPFDRPRHRTAVLAHPEYHLLRHRMLDFLEHAHLVPTAPKSTIAEAELVSAIPAAATAVVPRDSMRVFPTPEVPETRCG